MHQENSISFLYNIPLYNINGVSSSIKQYYQYILQHLYTVLMYTHTDTCTNVLLKRADSDYNFWLSSVHFAISAIRTLYQMNNIIKACKT